MSVLIPWCDEGEFIEDLKRNSESKDTRADRLQKDRKSTARKNKNESSNTTTIRLEKMRKNAAHKRNRADRLQKDRKSTARKAKNESSNTKAIRPEKKKEYGKNKSK